MRPEKHADTHPVTASLAGQKSAKLSGLTDNPEGADAGGFLALLASQCQDSPSVAGAVETDGSDTLGKSSLTESMPDLSAGESAATAGDTASAAGNASQIDLTFLLSQSGSLLPVDRLETSRVQLRAAVGGLPAMELVSNADRPDGLPLDHVKNALGGLSDIATAQVNLKPGELYRPANDVSTAAFPGKSTVFASVSAADLMGDKAGVTDKIAGKPLADKFGALADTVAQPKAQDLRVLKLSGTADSFVSRTLAADPILVRIVAEGDLRQMERQVTKTSTGPSSLSLEGAFGSQVQSSGERWLTPPTSNGDGVQPEVYVAEQVNYWVSRDVQNAELKLKGFDDFPIDVHISMQGNDAQVDFRTDHAEIRDMLRTAEGHLKDMLAREGLVLSGVSVGTSRRDDQGQGEQQRPSFSRQQAVVVEDHLTLSGVSRPVARSGGAIDVFV